MARAMIAATGGSIVAGGDNLVMLNDDGSVTAAQAGRPLRHRLGNVQIIVFLVDPLHVGFPPAFFLSIAFFCPLRKHKYLRNVYICFLDGRMGKVYYNHHTKGCTERRK